MKAVEIAKNVYHVGVNDWNIKDFHGYSTPFGTSYNAFLVMDEQVALIDTVKHGFEDEMLAKIASVIDPKKIDVVVSNHTEMDHSGGLPRIMHYIGEGKPLYCSKMGFKNLSLHFGKNWNLQVVASGDEVSLGERTLSFMETRMLHWPDSMFTYLKGEKILFSSDAFGQHFAGNEMYDDIIGDAIMAHAQKYYANILLLYAPRILKLVQAVTDMGLEVDMICPDHGIIWRKDPLKIIDAYVEWSQQKGTNKAVLVYDSMWHSTEKMAHAIGEGLVAEGISTRPMSLKKWHRSDVMSEVLDAKALVVGSPTLNNSLFPTVSDMLTYLKGLKPQNKICAAFGSYGWSGEAVKQINQVFDALGLETVDNGLRIQYVPDAQKLKACFEYGRKIGRAVKGVGDA